jgi:hypothetical protein
VTPLVLEAEPLRPPYERSGANVEAKLLLLACSILADERPAVRAHNGGRLRRRGKA